MTSLNKTKISQEWDLKLPAFRSGLYEGKVVHFHKQLAMARCESMKIKLLVLYRMEFLDGRIKNLSYPVEAGWALTPNRSGRVLCEGSETYCRLYMKLSDARLTCSTF
jgi:hypothetical protein